MSLILDALKRLEAKAPARPPLDVEPSPTAPAPQAVAVIEEPAEHHEPLEASLAVDVFPAELPQTLDPQPDIIEFGGELSPFDWPQETPPFIAADIPHDEDVKLSLAALEGDVMNLDLEVQGLLTPVDDFAPTAEVEQMNEAPDAPVILEPLESHLGADETDEHVEQIEHVELDFSLDSFDETPFELDLQADFHIQADTEDAEDDIQLEPVDVAPVADQAAEDGLADESDNIFSLATLDDVNLEPVEVTDDVALTEVVDSAEPADSAAVVQSPEEIEIAKIIDEIAKIADKSADTITADFEDAADPVPTLDDVGETSAHDEEDVTDSDSPAATILSLSDYRAQSAAPEATEELADDYQVLAAQLSTLEYRGLRENILSQLPDEPASLLFAAPDEDADVAEVVTRLAESLAHLGQGEVVVILSRDVRGAYRASAEYGQLGHNLARSQSGQPHVPTLVIDPEDAVDLLAADLKRRCRWILFAADGPTARLWSPLCDAAYVVVALNGTDRRAAVKSVSAMQAAGGQVLGCVLTNVPDVA